MIGTEAELLAVAVMEGTTNGTEWMITNSREEVVWTIECDNKVDKDDLVWPVIVHLRGSMGTSDVAILTEIVLDDSQK